ncbi:lysophospholipase-like protein 1 [Agrilus planipennis]|uniref:palmitoyl-protein hydrolase n=1 Tax=Agrilus planipennis TaxID=224129 RepID=A0A1W4WU75_AGRPL|nr:lysophospholipase-like protein 1 [Agrilus planipennis]XP_018327451.1 lysophospholipase-like protein 1 [Agrilus planipennis]
MSSKMPSIRTIPQTKTKTGTVIFLHGSGDSGKGIMEWIQSLVQNFSLPHINFIFPTAPPKKYTPLNGQISNVWFDRFDIRPDVPEHLETLDSTAEEIKSLIMKEVSHGTSLNRIVVGGFSMGGALALHLAYRYLPDVAGVFALSSFLNNGSVVYNTLKSNPPKRLPPLLMFHGLEDELVSVKWGEETFRNLKKLGVNGQFVPLNGTTHELSKVELEELLKWIMDIVPEE